MCVSVGTGIGQQHIDLPFQGVHSLGVLKEQLLQDDTNVLDVPDLFAILPVDLTHLLLEGQFDVLF